jgi:Transposase DDE domain
MLGHVFQRFVQRSPLSVMVRGTLERVLGAEQLKQFYERTANNQYTRERLFSTVYELMSDVVFRHQPSVRAAYQARARAIETSLASVYNKLNGLETHTSAELVRDSAAQCTPLIAQVGGEREPWLDGHRVKIIDGNGIEASQRRLGARREVQAAALPGKSLVVYEPACGLVTDVVPCEDGHAQERSLFKALLRTAQAGDLWIADRNFCPREFLAELDGHGAFFVIREPQGLPFEMVSSLGAERRLDTGQVAEQRVRFVDANGHVHRCRRLRLKRKEATRDGETLLDSRTHVPRQTAATECVSELSRTRWTLETACKHIEASLHAEITPLGSPKAALCGFCLALVAYNVLAVVLAALRGVHGQEKIDQEVSLYYVANAIATTYTGMMIAIPEPAWGVFSMMSTPELAETLVDLAHHVRLEAFRKSPSRARKTRSNPKRSPQKGHVSTAKLLKSRKAKATAP